MLGRGSLLAYLVHIRLQVVFVAEVFDMPNKPATRLDLPMARADAVKAAAALGDEGKQASLL